MKDSMKSDSVGSFDDMPIIIEDEVLKESQEMIRKAAESSNYKVRKSIEDLQETRRLHDLIDDYDFDGIDDEDE